MVNFCYIRHCCYVFILYLFKDYFPYFAINYFSLQSRSLKYTIS